MLSSHSAYLGLDAGTSSCKAVVIDDAGVQLAEARAPYPVHRGSDGSVTGDAQEWLEALFVAARRCTDALSDRVVEAVAITAPAHGAVLVGEDDEPLYPVLLGSDRRPDAVAIELGERLGQELYGTTWCTPGAGWTLPQLAWLSRSEPIIFMRTRLALLTKDYLRYRLTGELATDPSDATGTALFDPARQRWVPELLAEAGLEEQQLPPVLDPRALGGRIRGEAAALLGVAGGTPVAVGATDTIAELASLGALEPGSGLVKIATTGTVVAVTDAPRPDRRWVTYPHVAPGRWASFTVHSTAGAARTWAEEQLQLDPESVDTLAADAAAGCGGLLFLPFLEGERSPYWTAAARGAFIGLTSAHQRRHLLRAVLEGVAYALRMGRDVLRSGDVLLAPEPFLSGGGLTSPLWRQIVTDVLGTPGQYLAGRGPAFGSALIARELATGVAIGELRAPPPVPTAPEPASVNTYDEGFRRYARWADLLAAGAAAPGRFAIDTETG